jgi:ABC exporter DevB family membrane fusion protein
MTRQHTLTLAVVIIGISTVAAQVLKPTGQSPASAQVPDTPQPHGAEAVSLVAAPGRVEPISEEIDVAAELQGRLTDVLVDEGAQVTRGQVVARLEHADYDARLQSAQARLAVAEAERLRLVNGARPEERREAVAVAQQAAAALEHAEIEVERHRRLFTGGVIAREALDTAERNWHVAVARAAETGERERLVAADARLDERARADAAVAMARAAVAEAQALLDKTTVRAPIDGFVLRRHRQAGESVSPDSAASTIVTIADVRMLRVRADVDERDVARLEVGQAAWVTADAYGDRRFEGRVVRVGRMLGRKTVRTDEPSEKTDTKVLETLVELAPGTRLPVGLRVDVFISTGPTATFPVDADR